MDGPRRRAHHPRPVSPHTAVGLCTGGACGLPSVRATASGSFFHEEKGSEESVGGHCAGPIGSVSRPSEQHWELGLEGPQCRSWSRRSLGRGDAWVVLRLYVL